MRNGGRVCVHRGSRVDPLVRFLEAHMSDNNIFNDDDVCKDLLHLEGKIGAA